MTEYLILVLMGLACVAIFVHGWLVEIQRKQIKRLMEAWKNSRELNKENARYVLTHIMNSYIIEEDYEKANKCKEFIDALDSPTANF